MASLVIGGLFALLLLLFLCTPMETHRRGFEQAKKSMRELIAPHALFFKWNAGLSAGLLLLGDIGVFVGSRLEWPGLTNFGNGCTFFGYLSLLGFLWVLKLKAEAQHNQRIGEALFTRGGTIMKTDIGALHNYGGNVALGDKGSQINQTSFGNSVALHQRIHSLIETVGTSGNELTAPQKTAAIEKLNTVADQSMRPKAQREESKIKAALKVLPGLLSSASTLAQEWDKLEPWIRSHFGN